MNTEYKKPENPPAFPVPASEQTFHNQTPLQATEGMSLRDYFAAKAMAAQIKNASVERQWDRDYQEIAKCAYDQADAMLNCR